jgi:hypothetical protein
VFYFLHGNNQQALKDYIFNLKKRAPLTEEIDARVVSADEFFAQARTSMLSLSEKNARLIVISHFLESPPLFQEKIKEKMAELAHLPDVFLFSEGEEVKDKEMLKAFSSRGKVQKFHTPEANIKAYDPTTSFLFGCANAWIRGNRAGALRAACAFFESGGAPEQLLHMLAAYAKKTKTAHATLRFLRDQFIAARLQKADVRSRLLAFISQL